MKKLKYIIPLSAMLIFGVSAMAQDPPPPGGGGAPTGGNTPVSTPLSSLALIIAGAGVAVVAWKNRDKEGKKI